MTSSAPCLADVFPLCCRLFFTFWVTPENESAKGQLRRFPCFSAGFSGAPKGCPLHLASAHPHRVHKSAHTEIEDPRGSNIFPPVSGDRPNSNAGSHDNKTKCHMSWNSPQELHLQVQPTPGQA